ncbi:bifunctional hydroxymethylpyrimidine kinase/phosphomethylpyrimidine kinase [Alphaproteobacteria bacterium]|nr:bifunctional hydroxymethylpyrimidine kinase/phosphomethylpyrimidine kinase [bacterium]MDC0148535.1 bifunctional hydroxymethylpyrimidine kinase/phosphomethylpyrimidine kinase [Alphaproteobacteria bacterium]MDC1241037.1 bifunctional hydroxymethylpyrimidine kinase/phosphomethylpyrimidine kinase [bacterium]
MSNSDGAASSLGRVLVIAGSDSGGGAGIQADIKSIMAQGAYATTAITALTAQNTHGVDDVLDVPAAFVARQIQTIMADIGTDIFKTGMLHRREIIELVAQHCTGKTAPPLVVDPVMVATSGHRLLEDKAIDVVMQLLVEKAYLVTPNLPEASLMTRRDVETLDDMKRAADTLMNKGAHAALIKGGHGQERVVYDLLAQQNGFEVFENQRLITKNTHGTGCTLASAIAGQLARQVTQKKGEDAAPHSPLDISQAVQHALGYVHHAIATAPDNIGSGHGPLNHLPPALEQ